MSPNISDGLIICMWCTTPVNGGFQISQKLPGHAHLKTLTSASYGSIPFAACPLLLSTCRETCLYRILCCVNQTQPLHSRQFYLPLDYIACAISRGYVIKGNTDLLPGAAGMSCTLACSHKTVCKGTTAGACIKPWTHRQVAAQRLQSLGHCWLTNRKYNLVVQCETDNACMLV